MNRNKLFLNSSLQKRQRNPAVASLRPFPLCVHAVARRAKVISSRDDPNKEMLPAQAESGCTQRNARRHTSGLGGRLGLIWQSRHLIRPLLIFEAQV
jgi:hypothetical protein